MGLTQVNSGGINDNTIVNADLHSAANIASTKLAKPIDLADNEKVRFGTGNDLEIYHSGSHSFIEDTGTGGLYIRGANNIGFRDAANSYNAFADFTSGGSAELYYNGNKKFATKSDGIDVQGEVQCDSLDVDGATDFAGNIVVNGANYNAAWDYSTNKLKFNDNAKAAFGTSSDLQIYHDGSNSYIDDSGTGDLYIRSNRTRIGKYTGEDSIVVNADGDVEIFHDNDKIFETFSGGVNILGELECDSLDVDGAADISGDLTVGGIIKGTGSDFEVGYFASNSTAAVKRIRMVQGGELHFGDTTTTNFCGITEGTVNQFADTDRLGIYYRNELKIYSNNNTARWSWDVNGHYVPSTNNAIDIGSSSNRVRNIYTNDMNLSNEGSSNDVDGTWGSWTIQEGEDDLFLLNRRNGKKYKFNLTEVN